MAMDFPASPTNGQLFTFAGVSYVWNGYAWISASAPPAIVPGHVLGEPSSGKAIAGEIGELIENIGTGVPLQSGGVGFNVASITLTPGDWDISGVVQLSGAPITVQQCYASIGNASATNNSNTGWFVNHTFGGYTSMYSVALPILSNQVSLSANTVYYLVGSFTANAGSGTASGKIRARRMR